MTEKSIGEAAHKSGYSDMRSQKYEQNVLEDAFNKVCSENQRMRDLLKDAVGDENISGRLHAQIESLLAETS